MSKTDINKLRKKIDDIDAKIVKLIAERRKLSTDVGNAKNKANLTEFIDHAREAKLLKKIIKHGGKDAPKKLLERIYREILSDSVALQQPVKVSYLGPRGTYSEEVAQLRFGAAASFVPQMTIKDCFTSVEQEHSDYAIVPYENSIDGGIGETLNELVSTSLYAVGVSSLRIVQCLLSEPNTKQEDIVRLFYHPVSYSQCSQWLRTNLLPLKFMFPCASNGKAAEMALASGKGAATIGSRVAAKVHGLTILQEHIEDNSRNKTKFLILGRKPVAPSGKDVTSLTFSVRHKPGALMAVLNSFASKKLSLSRLESRPVQGGEIGQYMFFVDVDGHKDKKPLVDVISEISEHTETLKVLGSYPAEEN